jgi:hypothetical protein
MFCWGIAIRLPAMMVSVASPAASGTQSSTELPMPSRYRRKITTNPAAFGATDSHATNGVLAAS